jgi:uncharacterized protein (TIGR02001 family)
VTRPSRAWPAAALAIPWLAILAPAEAAAQASFSLGGESDYRVRGVSLSNGRPVARAGVAYDHRSGLYGGATALVGTRAGGRLRALGGVGYVGVARRLGSGLTTDFGVTSTRISSDVMATAPGYEGPYGYVPPIRYRRSYRADYSEVYAGLSRDNVSIHLYLSPNYLRPGQGTAYVDVNAAIRPAPRVRVFGHAGVLAPLERETADRLRSRADLRLGVAWEFDHAEVQLAWTSVTRRVEYPRGYARSRDAVVLSASAYF